MGNDETGHSPQNPLDECNGDVMPTILGRRWLLDLWDCRQDCSGPLYRAATVGCSRLHTESPGDPIASKPSVAGSEVGMVRAASGSSTLMSSGPLVCPVKIDLLGMVS